MSIKYLTTFVAFVCATYFNANAALGKSDLPNIVWLSCEDISPHMGCFGDENAITPNLDQLATEGVRYVNVFTTAGVCAPCRSAIITGMYQTTLGTHHMRCNAQLPDFVNPFPVYLRQAGYYCTNNSKQDYQFQAPRDTWDESSGKAHWRNRNDKGQPFFSVFNFTGCHESGIASRDKYLRVTARLTPEQRQDPAKLNLPPYYPDTPTTREDWKRNYELITAMDAWAGDLIRQLKEDGLYETTIIFFWSDHGVGLPRAKRWLYDSGTHVPLIIRIPEHFSIDGKGVRGTVVDRLISSLDFGPTVLSLAGQAVPSHVQGRAFLGSHVSAPREYVYGARDRMDERYDIIRAVRDKSFRYIRNYEPFKAYYQTMNTPEKGATMRELRRLHAAGHLPPAAQLFMAEQKPVEELYDLAQDPHEIRNLAGDPDYQETLHRMRAAHLRWVAETRDLGLIPESEIQRRKARLGSQYHILRQPHQPALMTRIRDVANLNIGRPEHLRALTRALDDADAVVRYWAAIGLGNLGDEARPTTSLLEKLLSDEAPCVRIAAARALLALQESARALPVLAAELTSRHPWGRLRAALVLDEAGELARPLIPSLRKCLSDQPNKYITRVANHTLNVLLKTNNTVR